MSLNKNAIRTPSLDKLTIRNTEMEVDQDGNSVLHVKEPHALLMAAGYFKHLLSKEGEGIYFRGQRKLYGSLIPILFRGQHGIALKRQKSIEDRSNALATVINNIKNSGKIFNRFGAYALEPLLQHYGVKTTWVDVVDNVWVALWFACYRALYAGDNSEYLHFERRIPSDEEKFAYVLLVSADISFRNREKPGLYTGDNTELVDLRMAVPSVFLRPHAQHGLLLRKKGASGSGRSPDYSGQIRGVIRVELSRALDWLGDGKMAGIHSLFPPPYYDNGYQILLSYPFPTGKDIGSISHIGA